MITQNIRKGSSTLAEIPAGSRVSDKPVNFFLNLVCNVKKNIVNRTITDFLMWRNGHFMSGKIIHQSLTQTRALVWSDVVGTKKYAFYRNMFPKWPEKAGLWKGEGREIVSLREKKEVTFSLGEKKDYNLEPQGKEWLGLVWLSDFQKVMSYVHF